MAINLVNLLKDQFNASLVSQAAGYLGEGDASTRTAIDTILPTILSGIVQKGTSDSGAGRVINMLMDGKYDGSLLNNLGSLFTGDEGSRSLIAKGNTLLSFFLGDKQKGILDTINTITGMKEQSTSSLFSLLAPVVMSLVGKQVQKYKLNASGLKDILAGQKDFISSALPGQVSSIIGFSQGGQTGGDVQYTQKTVAQPKSAWPAILGLAGVALLVLGGLYYTGFFVGQKAAEGEKEMATPTEEPATEVVIEEPMTAPKDTFVSQTYILDGENNLRDARGTVIFSADEYTIDSTGLYRDSLGNQLDVIMQ